MAISKSKRRYSVSLTPSVVARFQTLAKELGMPPSVMSAACEDAIKGIADVFQMAKEKGSLDIEDMRRLMGQQLELMEGDNAKPTPKAKTMEKRTTSKH